MGDIVTLFAGQDRTLTPLTVAIFLQLTAWAGFATPRAGGRRPRRRCARTWRSSRTSTGICGTRPGWTPSTSCPWATATRDAQRRLRQLGVDIDAAANGVYLPRSVRGPDGRMVSCNPNAPASTTAA